MNNKLLKAGLSHLIETSTSIFISRLIVILQKYPDMVDFLFDGPPEITEEITKKIEDKIKSSIAIPANFINIKDVIIDFNYSGEVIFKVNYNVIRYFNSEGNPYGGLEIADESHSIETIQLRTEYINPQNL